MCYSEGVELLQSTPSPVRCRFIALAFRAEKYTYLLYPSEKIVGRRHTCDVRLWFCIYNLLSERVIYACI